jgi:HSP20 family protein
MFTLAHVPGGGNDRDSRVKGEVMAEQTTLPARKAEGAAVKWDPFGMFDAFQEEMDLFWRSPWFAVPTTFRRPMGQATSWAPRLDVFEKDNTLVVKAELPGVKNEDVQVELEDGTLVIKGETKAESEAEEDAYYRMERTYGKYYRRLPLPFDVSPEQVQAKMDNGVLELRIPKPTLVKPEAKKIAVG